MIKLFTHTDLDGVGCAILAKLAFKDNVEITYCNTPNDLWDKLKSTVDRYEMVYMTDLSLPNDSTEYYADGSCYALFDHHKTAEWMNKFDFAHVNVECDGRLTCGTELFYNYLIKKSLISPRPFFVEQVRLYDTWDWAKTNTNTPKYLNDLLYIMGISEFVDTYADKLKRNDVSELTIFTGHDLEMLSYEQKQIDNYVAKKCASAIEIIFGGHKCMLSFADRYQSILGNKMCSIKDYINMAVMVNIDEGVVSLRSIGDVDVADIAKQYGGGGHKNSAGFKLTKDSREYLFKKLLANNFAKWYNRY